MICCECFHKMVITDVDCEFDVGDLTRYYKCRCGVKCSVKVRNWLPVHYLWTLPIKKIRRKVVKK